AALAETLCDICHLFGERQWCLATSGNFSARIDGDHFLITQSGKDKARLTPDDLMICDMQGQARDNRLDPTLLPSAETALHLRLYLHDPGIGAVFHTHSTTATILSRRAGRAVDISGYEMQKAFAGIRSHETQLTLPVFDNTQDMAALADSLGHYLGEQRSPAPGFLIRGHGLYGWGRDVTEAQRHVEALEFLLSCVWQEYPATRQ
ncbi:MAG TPA: methylthioribulose 1-phosphate dehydratase, partial [Woeseiaceae bacterium]|nr:methylthioribulose 1-phosphate dehydratase [Woeseiaceae bacterium]